MLKVSTKLRKYCSDDLDKFTYFHKTEKGGYAEKDVFLGITVPNIRKVAKEVYLKIELDKVSKLLNSKYHEERLCAVIILVYKMKVADCYEQEQIVDFYIQNADKVNGWDLVDLSAPYILGEYLLNNMDKTKVLYKLSASNNMWIQRISIVSNLPLIKKGEYTHILNLARVYFNTKHDLIQKAVGWMLREVGKKSYETLYDFLCINYNKMPRTMLRYSIEKFDNKTRRKFLKGEI